MHNKYLKYIAFGVFLYCSVLYGNRKAYGNRDANYTTTRIESNSATVPTINQDLVKSPQIPSVPPRPVTPTPNYNPQHVEVYSHNYLPNPYDQKATQNSGYNQFNNYPSHTFPQYPANMPPAQSYGGMENNPPYMMEAQGTIYSQTGINQIPATSQMPHMPPSVQSSSIGVRTKSPIIILSIDGAAVRGLGQLEILKMVEESLGMPIVEIFDFFAGTSAGSINIGGLLTPNPTPNVDGKIEALYSVEKLINEIAPQALKVAFHNPLERQFRVIGGLAGSRYSAKPFEAFLQRIIAGTRMSDLVKPAIITSYDFRNREVFNFSTFDACKDESKNYETWMALRASSAAPVYYKPFNIIDQGKERALIDAGLFVMSPALLAWIEMYKRFPDRPIYLLSISSGYLTEPRYVRGEGATAGNIPDVLQDTIEASLEGQAILTDLMLRGLPNLKYHRLTFKVTSKEFDDTSPENVRNIKEEARAIRNTSEFRDAMYDLYAVLKERKEKNDLPPFVCRAKMPKIGSVRVH